jgi:hypothetical protein
MEYRTLSFHVERTQPLSDLFGNQDGIVSLTAERPMNVTVSLMTSRGLSAVETVKLDGTPFQLRYDPPWGLDWVVLQIQSLTPLPLSEPPYTVKLFLTPVTKIERVQTPIQQSVVSPNV